MQDLQNLYTTCRFYIVFKCIYTYMFICSSNINEVTRAILNSFIQKSYKHKKPQNTCKQAKINNAPKKHLRGK